MSLWAESITIREDETTATQDGLLLGHKGKHLDYVRVVIGRVGLDYTRQANLMLGEAYKYYYGGIYEVRLMKTARERGKDIAELLVTRFE
ncbi:MAG: hypothetical protein WAM70_11870 [Pyrinomonadaceae bacterium]